MRHHLPQKVLHSKGGSHKDTLLCTPLLWDTPSPLLHPLLRNNPPLLHPLLHPLIAR